jgi:hypothetical protein
MTRRKVSDFESTEALVAYVKKLKEDQALYDSYHEWKTKDLPPQLTEAMWLSLPTWPCRVCEHVHGFNVQRTRLEKQEMYDRLVDQLVKQNQFKQYLDREA